MQLVVNVEGSGAYQASRWSSIDESPDVALSARLTEEDSMGATVAVWEASYDSKDPAQPSGGVVIDLSSPGTLTDADAGTYANPHGDVSVAFPPATDNPNAFLINLSGTF